MDAGGLPSMVSALNFSTRASLRKEVLWALSNLSNGNSGHIEAMADAGVFVCLLCKCVCVCEHEMCMQQQSTHDL